MPLRGILRVRTAQTSAIADVWAACVYPSQGAQSFGQGIANVLRAFDPACVIVCDARNGRMLATVETGVKTAIRDLMPVIAAKLTPVVVVGQTATQWNLVSDPWSYGGGALANLALPQLSKRTVGGIVDRALALDPWSGFAIVDQDAGEVRVWSDFNEEASPALAQIAATGDTVAAQFQGFTPALIFEGGPT